MHQREHLAIALIAMSQLVLARYCIIGSAGTDNHFIDNVVWSLDRSALPATQGQAKILCRA
jgi:hypothetical protein